MPAFDPDQSWHYVEYGNGELELYDLTNDPWELENLAADASKAALMASLLNRLAELRTEGIGPGTGVIRMVEDARPESSTDYQFTGDLGSFTLDDDADAVHPSEMTFADLPAGIYRFGRSGGSGLGLAGIECDGVHQSSNVLQQLAVYIHPGETVTCTWIDAVRQPDASVASAKTGPFKADGVYRTTAHKSQTIKRTGVLGSARPMTSG